MANKFLQALNGEAQEDATSGPEPTRPEMQFGSVAEAQALIGDRKGMIVFCPAPDATNLPTSKSGKQIILGAAMSGWGDTVPVGNLRTQVAFRWTMQNK